MLDDFERRVVDRRQSGAEFGPGPAFDPADQHAQYLVEDLDLLFAEALAAMQEKIGHLTQGIDPLLRRATLNGVFEFGDDGMLDVMQDTAPRSFDACRADQRFPESRRSANSNADASRGHVTFWLKWRGQTPRVPLGNRNFGRRAVIS